MNIMLKTDSRELGNSNYNYMSAAEFILLSEKALDAINYIEKLIFKGAKINYDRSPWWKKLLRIPQRREESAKDRIQDAKFLFIKNLNRAKSNNIDCVVTPTLLKAMNSWINQANEYRGLNNQNPYR